MAAGPRRRGAACAAGPPRTPALRLGRRRRLRFGARRGRSRRRLVRPSGGCGLSDAEVGVRLISRAVARPRAAACGGSAARRRGWCRRPTAVRPRQGAACAAHGGAGDAADGAAARSRCADAGSEDRRTAPHQSTMRCAVRRSCGARLSRGARRRRPAVRSPRRRRRGGAWPRRGPSAPRRRVWECEKRTCVREGSPRLGWNRAAAARTGCARGNVPCLRANLVHRGARKVAADASRRSHGACCKVPREWPRSDWGMAGRVAKSVERGSAW